MSKKSILCLSLFVFLNQLTMAQKTSSSINFTVSPFFTPSLIGTQLGVNKSFLRKNKKLKKVKKNGFLGIDLGAYNQSKVNNGFSISGYYESQRLLKNGFYVSFKPQVGLMKTFLNEESYSVSEANEVTLNGLTGDLYVTSGLAISFGKKIKDVNIGLGGFTQIYFPNFRFITLRPAFQLSLGFSLKNVHNKK